MSESYVYFVKPIGMDGPIKIGHSKVPTDRLMAFAIWSPFPLEMIGTVPGGCKEENWLHRCFSDLHSHREWFRSSPRLREAIRLILDAGSVRAAEDFLEPKAPRGRKPDIIRHPRRQKFLDINRRVILAERALRAAKPGLVAWRMAPDVQKILGRWTSQEYSGGGWSPADAEMARINEYLADPERHSVVPAWHQRVHEDMAEREAQRIQETFDRSAECAA